MNLIKKMLLVFFSYLYLGFFGVQGLVSDAHHTTEIVDKIPSCTEKNICCENEQECLQKCFPEYTISLFSSGVVDSEIIIITPADLEISLLSYYKNNSSCFYISQTDYYRHKTLFLLSYIGKQKITG